MPFGLEITSDQFWLWMDRVSIILSYFVVFSIAAFVLHWFRFRRMRRQIAKAAARKNNPRALAICFREGPVKTVFQRALKKLYPDQDIPIDEYTQPDIKPKDVHKHLEAFRRLKEQYMVQGVSELHIAFKGPVAMAVAIGAIFDNWVTVIVYHHHESQYEPWFTLSQAKAMPRLDFFEQ